MEVYRKIAVGKTEDDLKQVEGELADMYGPMPDEVELLLELARLRIGASNLSIKSIVTSGQELVFSLEKDASVQAKSLFADVSGTVRITDPKTVYLRLGENYFEPKTLINVLRKILNHLDSKA